MHSTDYTLTFSLVLEIYTFSIHVRNVLSNYILSKINTCSFHVVPEILWETRQEGSLSACLNIFLLLTSVLSGRTVSVNTL